MRVDPAQVGCLPLPVALVDRAGRVIAQSPEWQGAPPGSLSYHAEQARLVISAGAPARPEQDAIMRRLLDELDAAVAAMEGDRARCAAVLASSLELVAGGGRGGADEDGTVAETLDMASAAIRARAPDARVQVDTGWPEQEIPAPAQIALGLVQFGVNAAVHERVTDLRLRVGPGPSFFVEWRSDRGGAVEVSGRRHPRLRERWGLGYVRVIADALGATALPPGPTMPGWSGACLSLGSRRLTLPLAVFTGDRVARFTQTWQQEVMATPRARATLQGDLRTVLEGAAARPGEIARGELMAARRSGRETWVALPPDTGEARARDVLHGLDHERALWSGLGAHALRIHGLIAILERSLGEPPRAFAPDAFARDFTSACAALGVTSPATGPTLAWPDPRLTAFLLAELGGTLKMDAATTWLRPHPQAAGSPIARLLGADDGRIALTPMEGN